VLDSATSSVARVLGSDDLKELRAEEAAGLRRARGTPRALIRYAVVPRAGVFRLSRLGAVSRILDTNLASSGGSPDPMDLGPAHAVLALLPAESNGVSLLGVARRHDGRTTFSYLDAHSLGVAWETDVAQGAIACSFYAALDGSTFYIDQPTGAVNRLSPDGKSSTSWRLPLSQSSAARILSIDLEP
jgi:hypothetical protein